MYDIYIWMTEYTSLQKYDYELNMHIGGMDAKDLIAAKAMYHRSGILTMQ